MSALRGAAGEGWLWLGGSLLLAVLSTNLAWFFRRPRTGAVSRLVAELVAWRFFPSLLQFLRLLYCIGLPFTALLWGHDAVVRRVLGLQVLKLPGVEGTDAYAVANWLDWARDLGWAVVLGVGTWGLLALGWWAYRRAVARVDGSGSMSAAHTSGWLCLGEAACHEAHWAFYRNAPVLLAGEYWGVWVGLSLVALEAALNPFWREGLTDPERAPGQLLRVALAVVSSALFLLTENLWLALVVHWGVSWGLAGLVGMLPLVPDRHLDQTGVQ